MTKEKNNNVEASVVRFFIDAALHKEAALSIIEESKGKLILQEKATLLFTLRIFLKYFQQAVRTESNRWPILHLEKSFIQAALINS